MVEKYKFVGSGVTNSQGVAQLTHDANGNPLATPGYVGSGKGLTQMCASLDSPTEVSSGSDLSEPYAVDDTYNYDDATLSNAHNIWSDGGNYLERHDTYSTVSDVNGADGIISTPIPSNCLIEFDLMIDRQVWAWCVEIGVTGWSLADNYASAQTNTWYHAKLEVGTSSSTMYLYNASTGALLGSKTKTHTLTASRLYLRSRDAITVTSFKNVRIYNV